MAVYRKYGGKMCKFGDFLDMVGKELAMGGYNGETIGDPQFAFEIESGPSSKMRNPRMANTSTVNWMLEDWQQRDQ